MVEILSLREALPEKQSPKRGVATWASAMGNKKGRKRNGYDIGEREEERREWQAVQECKETSYYYFPIFGTSHSHSVYNNH